MAATRLVSHLRSVWYAAAVCSEFELKEGRPPVLADLEQLQSRAQQLGREAASQAAADHPGKPLPKETVSEDVLPTEVRVAADPVLFSKHEMGLHEQKRLQSILGRHFSRRLQETVLSLWCNLQQNLHGCALLCPRNARQSGRDYRQCVTLYHSLCSISAWVQKAGCLCRCWRSL